MKKNWKFYVVKVTVFAYLLAGVVFSFLHLQQAAIKAGGEGAEATATPFAIDGMFVIGMVMRTDGFSPRARKIGFRVMWFGAAASLIGNVFAAHNLFGYIWGAALPIFIIFTEWLSDPKQMESIESYDARVKAAEDAAAAAARAAEIAANRELGRQKAAQTRASKAALTTPGATLVDEGGLARVPAPATEVPPPPPAKPQRKRRTTAEVAAEKRTGVKREPRDLKLPEEQVQQEINDPIVATVPAPEPSYSWAHEDTQMIPLVKEESSNPAPIKSNGGLFAV